MACDYKYSNILISEGLGTFQPPFVYHIVNINHCGHFATFVELLIPKITAEIIYHNQSGIKFFSG